MSLPPVYVATVNVPGYLPMADEPACFDTAREAWAYLASERRRDEDQDEEASEYTDDVVLLDYVASEDHMPGSPHEDLSTSADGAGSLWCPTPGYTGDHDLGLFYAVSIVEHADYPHEAGRLHDCRACETTCHCTPGTTQCVYIGEHNV